jgi:hypothetical protein
MFKVPDKDPKSRANRFFFKVPRKWFRSTYSLPFLQFVPIAVFREAQKENATLQMQAIAEAMGEHAAAKAIGRLNPLEIAALEKGWLDGSGIDLGELVASSR